jgi:hypothetical protein
VQLNERQAVKAKAIGVFLHQFWEENNRNADLAEVLSDIPIEPDGGTHDLTAWFDWLNAVRNIVGDSDD